MASTEPVSGTPLPEGGEASPNSSLTEGVSKSSGSFELVFSVALFTLLGLGLDTLLDWRPILTVSFAIAGTIGAVTSIIYRYREAMKQNSRIPQ